MKCNFCGREVPRGTQECPYCHYRFEIEATVLNPQERDEFEGVTIDESGYEETRTSAGRNNANAMNAVRNTAIKTAAARRFMLKILTAAAVGCLAFC